MTVANEAGSVPGRVVDPSAARARHGDRADFMVEMLQVGDPLADAVIAEFDELGRGARAALELGLAEGLVRVPDAPPAVTALLADAETVPEWVPDGLLDEGDRISHAVPPLFTQLAFSAGSLTHTYASPAIAKLLVRTGRLTSTVPRRLAETGMWNAATVLPGGLRRGATGYVQSVQVRLLHARVRTAAVAHGWDSGRLGVPINQTDLARTWLDFTAVPFGVLEKLGHRLDAEEQSRLYHYWWYVGHLLGVDPRFFRDIESHAQAAELMDLLDSTTEAPDENSRALVTALYDATSASLAAMPHSPADGPAWRDLLHALARAYHGEETAAALGIPESSLSAVLPLLAVSEAKARHYQQEVPGAVRKAEEEGIAFYGQLIALLTSDTAYQENAAAS